MLSPCADEAADTKGVPQRHETGDNDPPREHPIETRCGRDEHPPPQDDQGENCHMYGKVKMDTLWRWPWVDLVEEKPAE